jgi:hypothetical protein
MKQQCILSSHLAKSFTLLLFLLSLFNMQYPRPEFVAADLSKVKLADALAATSFDPSKTTLFTAGAGVRDAASNAIQFAYGQLKVAGQCFSKAGAGRAAWPQTQYSASPSFNVVCTCRHV